MKVLQIGKYFDPFHGGMETVVKDLTTGLSEDFKDDVIVLCANHHISFRDEVTCKDFKIIRATTLGRILSQPIMPTVVLKLRSLIAWADIIHLHTPNPLIELLTLLLIGKKPLVITHHSDVIRQKLLAPLHLLLAKPLYAKANAVVVPTTNHVKTSKVLHNQNKNVRVIPFALNTSGLATAENINAQTDRPYFLFVGRLVGYKGLDVLIKAMEKVSSDVHLKIVGNGEEFQNLKELIHHMKLEHRVHLLGRVDDKEEFANLFNQSIALVLPSVSPNENFGMVQLEAMFYSKPIITTRLESGVPLVAEEGVSSLLVEPNNPPQLAQAMNKLASDPSLATQMGQEARKLFENKYQLSHFINSHRNLYQELLEHR